MSRQFLPAAACRAVGWSLVAAMLAMGWLGCASIAPSRVPAPARPSPQPASAPKFVTPNIEPSPAQWGPPPAKVVSLNPEHDFVVLDFTSRLVPPVGTRVDIYRNGKRIGAARITEPIRAQFATADILEGEVRVGDEVR